MHQRKPERPNEEAEKENQLMRSLRYERAKASSFLSTQLSIKKTELEKSLHYPQVYPARKNRTKWRSSVPKANVVLIKEILSTMAHK